jgi:hypothetical protein
MRWRLAYGVAAAASYVAFACGLGVVGAGPPELIAPDGSTSNEGGAAPEQDGSSRAADGDVTPRPKCDGGRYVDSLSTLDASSWIVLHDSSNGDYPKIDPSAEGPALSLVQPGAAASLGAIWLGAPIAMKAFDVTFRYLMTCPDSGACADGLAVAWLEATDAGAGVLQAYTSTSTFGLPPGVPGAAVSFDVHQDVATGDGPTPAISFLALDGSVPGTYDWHSKSVVLDGGIDGSHDVSIRVRQGAAVVKLDGTVVLEGPVSVDFLGWFGFSASSGADIGQFVVRSFDATFYECDDP